MVIISKTTLTAFGNTHTAAAEPLNHWYAVASKANWNNFSDIKKTFNSADTVGNDRFCFNIKGNDFRLITLIIFKVRTIFILWVGTHSAYDRMNKTIGAANVAFNK